MSYTLVIIDMQPKFDTSKNPYLIEQVKQAAIQAMQDDANILVVEFGGYDPTLKEITDIFREYDKVYYTVKHFDDGSDVVDDTIREKGLSTNLKVCGVNTSYCVHDTVMGLVESFGYDEIELLEKACNSYHDGGDTWRDPIITYLQNMADNGVRINFLAAPFK